MNCTHAQRVRICCHKTDHVRVNGHDRTIFVILAKHCTRLPDDGSTVIRNMLEHFQIFSNFNCIYELYLCISCIIKYLLLIYLFVTVFYHNVLGFKCSKFSHSFDKQIIGVINICVDCTLGSSHKLNNVYWREFSLCCTVTSATRITQPSKRPYITNISFFMFCWPCISVYLSQ